MSAPRSALEADTGGACPVAAGGAMAQRPARTNLFMSASLAEAGHGARDVRVRNLSTTGARIDCADPPLHDTKVVLCRGSNRVKAEVMWTSQGSCGLRFVDAIDVARWISDRPGAAATSNEEPGLADDLNLARRLVARLEEALAEQPVAVALLGPELQSLDLLAQLLQQLEKKASGAPVLTLRNLREAAGMFVKQSAGSGWA